MGLFDHFPYTNFHELNLDWILKMLKEIDATMEQFVAINALKYADPIQWNITSQYEKNTIVIDPQTGTAYISVEPVPAGVSLNNTDYWSVVFDLSAFVVRAAKNFTRRYEDTTTTTATFPTNAGEWLVWGDVLYRALVNITAGDSYVEGGNIEHITMEDVINYIENTLIGSLGDLVTSDTSSVVNAINSVLYWINTVAGDRDNLLTTDKTDLVSAINETFTDIGDEVTARVNADTTINNRITSIDPCEKFRNKTICIIGDSISDFTVLADNWVRRLTDFMADYDCTVINFSDAGRSFASLKNDLDNSLVTMPVADYYVLFIGTNYSDNWGFSTGSNPLNPAIARVHNAIITANSHAKYLFLSPIKKWINIDQIEDPISVMRDYLERYFAGYGYTVLSGYNLGELSTSTKTYYMMDDIHPNANLSDILFKYVLDGLISERSNITASAITSRAISNTLGNTSTITFKYAGLKMNIDYTVFGWTPTINTWVDLCDMPSFFDDQAAPLYFASMASQNAPQYRISGGKLQVYWFSAPSSIVFQDHLEFEITYTTAN